MWHCEIQFCGQSRQATGSWAECRQHIAHAVGQLPGPERPTVQLLLKDATPDQPWSCAADSGIQFSIQPDRTEVVTAWKKEVAVDHGEREHSDLGASSCERWWNCPGSLNLTRLIKPPPRSSPDAERGTAAHEVAHMCLLSGQDSIEMVDRVVNNVVVDEKMAYGVQMYLDLCRSFVEGSDHHFIEKRFNLKKLDPPEPMFGTADFGSVKIVQRTVIMVDYKNGYLYVDPTGPQLKYYVLGVLCELPEDTKIEHIEVFIVQPNGEGHRIKKASYTLAEIFAWSMELMQHAKATQDPNAPRKAGKWCKFCPNAGLCPTQAEAGMEAAQLEFVGELPPGSLAVVEWTPPEINSLTPDQIGALLLKVPLVKDFIKSLEEVAGAMICSGTEVPYWKLIAGLGHRKWIDPSITEKKLTGSYGLTEDQIWEKSLVSPVTVEKLLRPMLRALGVKGKRADEMLAQALGSLTTRPSTAPRLVRDTDPTPALLAGGDEFTAEPMPDNVKL